jgi:hypothetical protein
MWWISGFCEGVSVPTSIHDSGFFSKVLVNASEIRSASDQDDANFGFTAPGAERVSFLADSCRQGLFRTLRM